MRGARVRRRGRPRAGQRATAIDFLLASQGRRSARLDYHRLPTNGAEYHVWTRKNATECESLRITCFRVRRTATRAFELCGTAAEAPGGQEVAGSNPVAPNSRRACNTRGYRPCCLGANSPSGSLETNSRPKPLSVRGGFAMARRWRRPWIIKRKGKTGATFQVVYYDARRRRRAYDRSFRLARLAKEYARKLELYINGHPGAPGGAVRRAKAGATPAVSAGVGWPAGRCIYGGQGDDTGMPVHPSPGTRLSASGRRRRVGGFGRGGSVGLLLQRC